MSEESGMALESALELVVEGCLEDEVKLITGVMRKMQTTIDEDIKKMGLDTFHAAVYHAINTVSGRKCGELIKRIKKADKRF